MSNSSLITCSALSPNYTKGRNGKKIDTITLHVVASQINLAGAKSLFMQKSRQASSNYVITKDGEIILKVDEANRSWCTGGAGKKGVYYPVLGTTLNETGSTNDYHAVTVEISSDSKPPYTITDKALQSTIRLCADISKRNNIGELKFLNDPRYIGLPNKQNMTMHRWFDVNKKGYLRACPGDYLANRLAYICQEANKINSGVTPQPTPSPTPSEIITGKYIYKGVDYGYVFNPNYYADHNSDLKNAFGYDDKKLFNHFCTYGMKEGRQAISNFNLSAYKQNNPDLVQAYGNNNPAYYEHYCRYGYKEGRKAT